MATPVVGAGAPVQMTKTEIIRAYNAAGYTLIPLRGKIPVEKNWVETPPGKYHDGNLPSNYGVALKAGDLVIDVDPRNFAPGDKPLARLIAAIGPLVSFIVRTGGGGLHIYLRKSADISVVNGLKEFRGIEFKAAGRQVVGPFSIHPETGKEYVVVSGQPQIVTEAPAVLLALIKKVAVPFSDVAGTGEYKNDEATQGRYIAYLQDVAEPSVEGRGGDNNAFKVAAHGRDLGLPPATCWELMLEYWNKRCSPAWDDEELKTKVVNAYRFAAGPVGAQHPEAVFKDVVIPPAPKTAAKKKEAELIAWVTDNNGKMQKCFQNLVMHLQYPPAGLVGVFGQNDFTGRYEFTDPAPWHHGKMPSYVGVGDNDLKLLKGHLAIKHGYEADITNIEEAVTNVAHARKFHPVRDYLLALRWDGVPRLDNWLTDYLGVEDSDYTRAVARKTLCAAVARVMRPGCKFDHVLVFEGLQGIGKSTVCKILGGAWAADFTLDPHNKDSIQLMQGRWVIELAEMETSRKADLQALKAFISRSKDEARLAYGRAVGEFPRQSIFIGSINPGADGTYLQDDENRRWWPVMCRPKGGQVDFKALKEARDQLFAEAVVKLQQGEPLYMETAELKDAARDVVGERHSVHAWTERIAQWIAEQDQMVETRRDFLTSRQVYIDAMQGMDKQFLRREQLNIANVLYGLGWRQGHARVNGVFTRGFTRGEKVLNLTVSKIDEDKAILGSLA